MKIIIIALQILIFASIISAQNPDQDVLIDRSKPNVYLEFDKHSFYESPCGEPIQTGVWLRIRNNSKWAIHLDGNTAAVFPRTDKSLKLADGTVVRGMKDGARVVLRYDFEAVPSSETKFEKDRVTLFSPVEVAVPSISKYCSQKWMGREGDRGIWLASGESAVFSIPKLVFTDKLFVTIEYSYEWEAKDGFIDLTEPHHSIRFYGKDIPQHPPNAELCEPRQFNSPSDDPRCYQLQKLLIESVEKGDLDLVKKSLSEGANVNAGYYQSFRPLYHAIMSGKLEATKILLDNGALINEIYTFGMTPLKVAVYYKKTDEVELLLNRGADVCLTAKDDSGNVQTALDLADDQPIRHLLIQAGAEKCNTK